MSTGIKETIQNRATNQSAAWAVIAAIAAPLVSALVGSEFKIVIPVNTLVFTFALMAMFLIFISHDKQQEHDKAVQIVTEPKYLEQFLDRYKQICDGFSSAVEQAIKRFDDKGDDIQDGPNKETDKLPDSPDGNPGSGSGVPAVVTSG